MSIPSLCLVLIYLVAVFAGPEVSKDVEEAVQKEYRSVTVQRYQKSQNNADSISLEKMPSLSGQKGSRLKEIMNKPLIQDTGHVKNCMKDKKSQMDVTWTPEKVNISGSVTVTVDAVVPVNVSSVNGIANFYLPDSPNPFATYPLNGECKNLPPPFKGICPLVKGKHVKRSDTFNLGPYSEKIPDGTFIVVVKAKNESGEDFLCLNATITTYGDGR